MAGELYCWAERLKVGRTKGTVRLMAESSGQAVFTVIVGLFDYSRAVEAAANIYSTAKHRQDIFHPT